MRIMRSFLRGIRLLLGFLLSHPVALAVGVMAGLYCGVSVLFTGDDPQRPQGGLLAKLEIPLFAFLWVLMKLFGVSIEHAMRTMLLIHFPYWALLGGFVFVGVAAGWQKLVGDE